MPAAAVIVRLTDLQSDLEDPTVSFVLWAYKLYFCGVDAEEQGAVAAPASATQAQIKDLVNAVIVAAVASKGFVLTVDRIYTSSSVSGI